MNIARVRGFGGSHSLSLVRSLEVPPQAVTPQRELAYGCDPASQLCTAALCPWPHEAAACPEPCARPCCLPLPSRLDEGSSPASLCLRTQPRCQAAGTRHRVPLGTAGWDLLWGQGHLLCLGVFNSPLYSYRPNSAPSFCWSPLLTS